MSEHASMTFYPNIHLKLHILLSDSRKAANAKKLQLWKYVVFIWSSVLVSTNDCGAISTLLTVFLDIIFAVLSCLIQQICCNIT